MNIDNRFNRIFPSFSPLHSELSSSHRVIDNFSDCFVFNLHSKQKNNKTYTYQLDNMVIESSSSLSTTIVVTDTSIKNKVVISILHTHTHNNPIAKTIHRAVHVTSTKAELFIIRCDINQAFNRDNISKIIVITDSIYAAKNIFDPSLYLFQIYSVAILTKLCQFFLQHHNNSIEFWFKCLCSSYFIESRCHILHECNRFNRYWNPRRDFLGHFVMFLVANSSMFAFTNNIPLSVMTRSYN